MPDEVKQEDVRVFNETSNLSEEEKKNFSFVKRRVLELQEARIQQHYGVELEKVWADADKDYIPHRLKTKGRKVIAEDETLGWRGNLVTLGSQDWQSDIAQPNPYIKIQTALSILIDQNPVGVFLPSIKKYQATNELMRQLYNRSWEFAKSKQQLKLFVFNLAKYGWAVARTYPLRIDRKVKNLVEYDPRDPAKSKYEEKDVTEFNDIMRRNLNPWNVWIDDMARPNDPFSIRDWCWREVYAYDSAEEEFGKYKNWKFVRPNSGIVSERISGIRAPDKKFKNKELVEVFFYENRLKDLFEVIANGIPIISEPLPISDSSGNKKLSLWQTFWNLRHAESPYGIGIYEAIRFENATLDRIRNMTIDQLALSIYKMFFYQGTGTLTETGDIRITPGIGKQVLDPKNINWLTIPGPGNEAWKGLEVFKKDLDDSSGITESLMGGITGKTAFEIAQAKESALKRLRTPLDNITDALNNEAYITISLIQLLYSVPETYEISDQGLIEEYLNEVESDPDLFERGDGGKFTAKVFPEFPLNLDKDEKGNLIQTNDTRFFRVKPRFLHWEGIINVKSQSVLTPSKQVDKALELEMYNMLIPLLGNPPEVYSKIAKSIVKLYDKDPKDILPDSWTQETPSQKQPLQPNQSLQGPTDSQGQPLIIPMGQLGGNNSNDVGQPQPPEGQADKLVAAPQLSQKPASLGQRIISRMSKPFRKV